MMCLAIPGQIVDTSSEDGDLATVEVSGMKRTVNVGLLNQSGRRATRHVGVNTCGFAMVKIDEQEAAASLALLHEPLTGVCG